MFEITGMIGRIFDAQTFGKNGKGFTKREFILDVRSGDNLNRIKFECHGKDVKLLDDFDPGDAVEVEFGVKGVEWKDKFFVNLVAVAIHSQEAHITDLAGSEKDQAEVEEEVLF